MKSWIPVLALGMIGSAVAPSTAQACGGCFAPPGAVQVVTDHRMALSLSADRTILWDQFRYSGRPSDFSWILPIQNGPDVRIEVADNRFLTALDNLSAPVLNAPQRPYCETEADTSFGGLRGSAAPTAAADSGVAVLQEQVVGPYMTAVVRSEDPAALRAWLRDNGYAVPSAIEPTIDYYVAQRMDFIALRLRMGEGVEQMTPIRVTTPGLNPTLPLRMIAAGVADKVGLLLMVLAPSRYEAMNFPNGAITPAQLTYDFNAPTVPAEDFRRAFDALNRANANRLWLTESSDVVNRFTVERASQIGGGRGGPIGGATVTSDDAQLAFQGIGENATLTRLRADLSASALDRDLQLMASDLGAKDRVHTYGNVRNTPPPCGWEAGPRAEFLGCAVTPGMKGSSGGLLVAGLAGLGLAWRRRRRAVSAGDVASK